MSRCPANPRQPPTPHGCFYSDAPEGERATEPYTETSKCSASQHRNQREKYKREFTFVPKTLVAPLEPLEWFLTVFLIPIVLDLIQSIS